MLKQHPSPFPRLLEAPLTLEDERGSIKILYEVGDLVLKRSCSAAGVFRGLHRQTHPSQQNKLIRVLSGRIYDFVTDPDESEGVIWYRELSTTDDWILITANYAHGFYAIEDVEFEYLCDGRYDEKREKCYSVADSVQKALSLKKMYLSSKDKAGVPLSRTVCHFEGN